METQKYIARPKFLRVVEVTDANLISLASELVYRISFDEGKPCMDILIGGQVRHRACLGDFIVFDKEVIRVETPESMRHNYVDVSDVAPQIHDFLVSEQEYISVTDPEEDEPSPEEPYNPEDGEEDESPNP